MANGRFRLAPTLAALRSGAGPYIVKLKLAVSAPEGSA